LKERALLNMLSMLVTAETFHAERSSLKAVARNRLSMVVTAETSHTERPCMWCSQTGLKVPCALQ